MMMGAEVEREGFLSSEEEKENIGEIIRMGVKSALEAESSDEEDGDIELRDGSRKDTEDTESRNGSRNESGEEEKDDDAKMALVEKSTRMANSITHDRVDPFENIAGNFLIYLGVLDLIKVHYNQLREKHP